ncbi:Peroxiredoxin [Spironucleus salmonicida]|uniref:Peroxiredoxin n=1 Tax=Spironucleus salmonicida TaxID=348837 RepID=V6LVE0_9EUKA|nr:Peroxiredoxin [Spironucleus salmonicida]KAH0571815.1 Peroxiredoxin [Spironucleus salmonicida]|eukprot:EST43234.1 Peroxiredoxin [Spironucleus salmonicida]
MPIPQPGSPAPDFKVQVLTPDMTFATRQLSDYKGKYLVVMFYPMDFTFVCPSEIIKFTEAAESLRKHNCEIIVGSCDSHFSHYAWCLQDRNEGGIGVCKCDLFADKSCTMAEAYGVLIPGAGVPLRGNFIISDKGIIRSVTVNDLPVGRSVEECVRVVKAFQHADKTGCDIPCGWTPENNETITPTIAGMKEYFKKNY